MKKVLKLLGIILAIPVVGASGLFAYAWVQLVFYSLPTDGPRVVTTADYSFDAGESWLTQCAAEAPGCLAVSTPPEAPVWKKRLEWIEVQPVDAAGVVDGASYVQRANEVALGLVRDPEAAQLVRPSEEPFLFDGTQYFEVVNLTDADYVRTAFVRFPTGNILRFTCRAGDVSHDAACANALARVRFPGAADAYAAQVAAEQREARIAVEEAARQEDAVLAEAERARLAARAGAASASAPAPAPKKPEEFNQTLDAVERAYQESQNRTWGRGEGVRGLEENLEGMD